MAEKSAGATGSTLTRIGPYVVGHLATGGMAEIFLGKRTGPAGFERPVVIKRILPHFADYQPFVDMFLDEARIAAQIRHPNVVQVHELSRDGMELYQVQEYLEGETAVGLLRRLVVRDRLLPPVLAAHLVAEACAGLAAAHALTDAAGRPLGVVHRDVSPENVFVTYDGAVKILDFGIAQARDRLARTETGSIKGKFAYMSPEQCEGLELDGRSDLFSLGVVLHELITARRLFKQPNHLATIRAICERPIQHPAQLSECPPPIDAACMRALERKRDDRFPSAVAMRAELVAIVRKLGPDDPQRALAVLMQELFADRIAEKRAMLEKLAGSQEVGALPPAEADLDVVIDGVATMPEPERSRVVVWGAAAAAGLVLAGLAIALAVRQAPPPSPMAPANPAAANASASPPVTGPPAEVHIELASVPPGARVLVNGEPRGNTPLTVTWPRSDAALELELRLAGYHSVTRTLRTEMDQRLELSLERTRPRGKRASDVKGFHRF